jgi:hypothetical protein
MRVIYIAHPIGGDVKGNVERILRIVAEINLTMPDVVPFVPYLPDVLALDDSDPILRERCISNDRELFDRRAMDAVWLYGDRISTGMAAEIALARSLGIPVEAKTEQTGRALSAMPVPEQHAAKQTRAEAFKYHSTIFAHNMFVHPIMETCFWLSLMGRIRPVNRFGRWLHNITVYRGHED